MDRTVDIATDAPPEALMDVLGDLAKAIGAGADVAMVGSLFAGTDEAPGEPSTTRRAEPGADGEAVGS